ncbi:MAG TPA: DUF3299 domain-containing protein [bacterium]|nr:DUF3299 domain-containing protein [bacterium]
MVDFGSLSSFTVDETSMEEVIPSGNDLNTDPFEPTKIPVKKKNEIPAFIQALDGQKVEMVGFMIPLLTEKDKVLTFILAQSQMTCCYGIAPQLNQWIYVEMEKGKNTKWAMDVPITVSGILSVGKKYDKVNLGWSLYRMVSDNVELPKKGWF